MWWRYLIPAAALMIFAAQAQPAAAQSGADLVKRALEAQGGAAALRALKTIAVKGEAKHWEPGQSYSATGEARFLGDSTYTLTGDVATGMARIDWDRDMKYPQVRRYKYSEIIGRTFGVTVDEKGVQAPMPSVVLATRQRELTRATPFLMLRALDQPKSIIAMPDQKFGDQTLPAVTIAASNSRFIVLFDRTSHLPAVIRTRDDDYIYGDSDFDMMLSDWKSVGGVKLAHGYTFKLGGREVQRLTFKEVTVNAPVAPDAFKVSDDVKAKAKPAPATAPYQFVMRRTFLGSPPPSDKLAFADGGSYRLVELTPNVQHVIGGSHNNLIVAMKDGIVIFDAPMNEDQSHWVIDAAKKKYPGKPIKQVVLTHHHMDHTGGTRAYVADGAEIVIPAQARPFFEAMFKAPHAIAPDALAKKPKPAKIVEVKDAMTIKDDTVEVRLYNIANPHVDGMLIAHVVGPNILYVTDLISPRGPIGRSPATVAVGETLRKHNIVNATIAGGHGTTAKQVDIGPALAAN
jgi:glyoxylase-like metal-dependent hydrolase (beta-lactamase superfamily II)